MTQDNQKQDTYTTDKNHFLQTQIWVDVRKATGWETEEINIDHPALGQIKLFLYFKKVRGIGYLAYGPMWPNIFSKEILDKVTKELKDISSRRGIFLIQIEPAVIQEDMDTEALKSYGFILTGGHVQYRSTLVVDMAKEADEIFSGFNSTTRNEIRKAENLGVTSSEVPINEENLALFEQMLRNAQKRKQFYVRKGSFLRDYWHRFDQTGQGSLYLTQYNGEVVCMAFVIRNGQKAFYKDAAMNFNSKTQYIAGPVYQQWAIIKDLKSKGITEYDLCGALARGVESSEDPLWSVYLFKRRFTKNLITYSGIIDLPINTKKYKLWQKSKKLIIRAHTAMTREMWY